MNRMIAIIKGGSQYDTLRVFSDCLKEEFEELGHRVLVFDLLAGKEAMDNVLHQCIGQKIDALISFNAVGIDCMAGNLMIADLLGTTFYAYLVDHPMHHSSRLMRMKQNIRVITMDYDHDGYIKRYVKNIDESHMIPLGAMRAEYIKPYNERSINVMFSGTYTSPDTIAERINRNDASIKTIAWSVINKMLSNPNLNEEKAFKECLHENRLDDMLDAVPDFMENLLDIDFYVRAYKRHKVIEHLTNSGIKVDVYGNGWENFRCECPENLICHPAVGYIESLSVMADSKIVLNVMPEFKRGSHDRIVCAMANGAVSLTDRSLWLDASFVEDEEIVFYDADRLDALSDKVKYLLDNPSYAAAIAAKGLEKAEKEHMWEERAQEILRIME